MDAVAQVGGQRRRRIVRPPRVESPLPLTVLAETSGKHASRAARTDDHGVVSGRHVGTSPSPRYSAAPRWCRVVLKANPAGTCALPYYHPTVTRSGHPAVRRSSATVLLPC